MSDTFIDLDLQALALSARDRAGEIARFVARHTRDSRHVAAISASEAKALAEIVRAESRAMNLAISKVLAEREALAREALASATEEATEKPSPSKPSEATEKPSRASRASKVSEKVSEASA